MLIRAGEGGRSSWSGVCSVDSVGSSCRCARLRPPPGQIQSWGHGGGRCHTSCDGRPVRGQAVSRLHHGPASRVAGRSADGSAAEPARPRHSARCASSVSAAAPQCHNESICRRRSRWIGDERRSGGAGGGGRVAAGTDACMQTSDNPCGPAATDTADTGTRQRQGPVSPATANPDTESAAGPLPGHWSRLVAENGMLSRSKTTADEHHSREEPNPRRGHPAGRPRSTLPRAPTPNRPPPPPLLRVPRWRLFQEGTRRHDPGVPSLS